MATIIIYLTDIEEVGCESCSLYTYVKENYCMTVKFLKTIATLVSILNKFYLGENIARPRSSLRDTVKKASQRFSMQKNLDFFKGKCQHLFHSWVILVQITMHDICHPSPSWIIMILANYDVSSRRRSVICLANGRFPFFSYACKACG